MSLQTALTGLLGAQTGLDTVSNDLANAGTTAFKSQSALFGDIYPAGAGNVPGIGVTTSSISSDFAQGGLVSTGNPLDAAIQGNGFFIVSQNGQQQYTRDGSFQLNSTGQLVTSRGAQVLGYQGASTSGSLTPVTINTGAVPGKATSNVGLVLNLDSGASAPANATFSPTAANSYTASTSVVAYDSLGNANNVQLYLVAQPVANATTSYAVYADPTTSTGTSLGSPPYTPMTTLNFNSSGQLITGSPATLNVNWGNGAANSAITFDLTNTSLGNQSFAVTDTNNDGSAPGSYSGTTISSNGILQSTYSNGKTLTAGTIGIANFLNQDGLTSVSGNLYAENLSSGQPVVNVPGAGQAGTLSGGNLEQSNASTSSLLVSLIQYQQAYQANTSVIQTEQQDSTRLTQI